MNRYRVNTRAPEDVLDAWDGFLAHHVPEVVLNGRFMGAEVTEAGAGERVCDYSAPAGALPEYLENKAPALRDEAERLFPTVKRGREIGKLHRRVTAPFAWESLGLVDARGKPVPCPSNGPFFLAYVAPWCRDCNNELRTIATLVRNHGDRGAFVTIFSEWAESDVLLRDYAHLPRFHEPGLKDEVARFRTFHSVLRQLAADPRKWGVPSFRELQILDGQFVVSWK